MKRYLENLQVERRKRSLDRLFSERAFLDPILKDKNLRERVVQWVSGTEILSDILQTPEAQTGVVENQDLLIRILQTDSGIHACFAPPVRERLLSDPRLFEHLVKDQKLLDELLEREEVFTRLTRSESRVHRILDSEPVSRILRSHQKVLIHALSDEETLDVILADPDLQDRILRQPEWIPRLLNQSFILVNLLAHQKTFDQIFSDDILLTRFASHGRVIEKILTDDTLLTRVLSNSRSFEKLVSDDTFLGKFLSHGRVQDKFLGDSDLFGSILNKNRAIERLVNDTSLLAKILSQGRFFDQILADNVLREKVLAHPRTLECLVADADLLRKILAHGKSFEILFSEPRFFSRITIEGKWMDTVVSDEALMGRILSHGKTFNRLLNDSPILIKLLSHPSVVEKIVADTTLLDNLIQQPRTLKAIVQREDLLSTLLQRGEVIAKIKSTKEILNKVVLNQPAFDLIVQEPTFMDSILKNRRIQALMELDRIWNRFSKWVNTERAEVREGWVEARKNIKSVEEIPNILLDLICTRQHVHLKNGRLKFAERRALWILLHEIFVNEEYFFESETEAPRILDCGTHIGMAIHYFKALYPKAHITGFEPVPQIREIAENNLAENGWSDVEVLPYALGSEDTEVDLMLSSADSMAASTLDRGGKWIESGARITVPSRKLSTWLTEPIHFLKMDIEGPEVEVLEECGSVLKQVKTIFCEYHQGEKLPASRLTRLLRVLTDNEFDVQIGKSFSYQQTTEHRPATFLEGNYSGVLWAKNLKWRT